MNMGASSKTTAGLMTGPAQGNHTQSNLKEIFYPCSGKILKRNCKDCSRKSVDQGKFLSLGQIRRASSTVGHQCGGVVSWLENEDLPQCHRGGERTEVL